MPEIWVISEKSEQLKELLSFALTLSENVRAIAFNQEGATEAAQYCKNEVWKLSGNVRTESWAGEISKRAEEYKPDVILWGTTKSMKEVAARVAAKLDVSLITECSELELNQDGVRSKRYIYGGLCIQSELSPAKPFMATMSTKTKGVTSKEQAAAAIVEVNPNFADPCRVVAIKPKNLTANLKEAGIIVCIGRGITNQSDIKMAEDLAEVLQGKVGCTRPIAEELKWLPEESYIGISGQKVKPDLYIGLGVSGQIQHISGMRDSKTVIAVEKNENAPIVEAADHAFICDLYTLLPPLLKKLKDKGV